MNTTFTILIAALLTAAIITGAHYINESITTKEPKTEPETTWQTLTPNDPNNKNVPAGTSSARTNTPIKCYDPEIGEFWTNAATCEGADLNNRISNAQLLPTTAERDKYDDRNYETPEQEAASRRTDQKPVTDEKQKNQ